MRTDSPFSDRLRLILSGLPPPAPRPRTAALPRFTPRTCAVRTVPRETVDQLRRQICDLEAHLRARCESDIRNRDCDRVLCFHPEITTDRLAAALGACRDRLAILQANPPPPPPRKVELPNN